MRCVPAGAAVTGNAAPVANTQWRKAETLSVGASHVASQRALRRQRPVLRSDATQNACGVRRVPQCGEDGATEAMQQVGHS